MDPGVIKDYENMALWILFSYPVKEIAETVFLHIRVACRMAFSVQAVEPENVSAHTVSILRHPWLSKAPESGCARPALWTCLIQKA